MRYTVLGRNLGRPGPPCRSGRRLSGLGHRGRRHADRVGPGRIRPPRRPISATRGGPKKGTARLGSRVFAKGEAIHWSADWSELATDVPPGGIPTRLLRASIWANLSPWPKRKPPQTLLKMRPSLSGSVTRVKRPLTPITWPGAEASESLAGAVRRSGRGGNGIDHYLLWATRYHLKIGGCRSPEQRACRRARRDACLRPGHHHGCTAAIRAFDDTRPGPGGRDAHAEGSWPDSGTRASQGGQQCRVNRSTNSPPVVGKSVTATRWDGPDANGSTGRPTPGTIWPTSAPRH